MQSTPLNEVLITLRDTYNIQFSFNDEDLSTVLVTLDFSTDKTDQAIGQILKNTPFTFKKSGNVYLVYRKPVVKKQPTSLLISGKIMDAYNSEPLPFAHLHINNRGITSDLSGNFTYTSKSDSILPIQISFLGYYILDTVLTFGNHELYLTPSTVGLKEIVVQGHNIETSQQVGDEPGVLRLNNKIVSVLPGNGDNSVFNLLRLQPGILAAGEQSSDIIIWGSYEGQSQVLFDGFTLFGLKNFNDNISNINPFMLKDIQVYKGAYSAKMGERVGGIVDIAGLEGSFIKPSFNFNINNMTINAKVSVPLFGKSSLTGAFRHTFYNLYETENIIRDGNGNQEEFVLKPDYTFRDFNLKYAGETDTGSNYYISTYKGDDSFAYSFDFDKINENGVTNNITKTNNEINKQWGASAYYSKVWKKGNSSNMLIGASSLNNSLSDKLSFIRPNQSTIERQEQTSNNISEYFIKNENRFVVSQTHAVEFGTGFLINEATLKSDSADVNLMDNTITGSRFYGYVQDNIALGKHFSITPGLRLYYALELKKVVSEPRLATSIKFNNRLKLNASWGKHHQFISKSAVIDEYGQYRFLWTVADNENSKVVSANHFVVGPSYNYNGLTVSLEGYYKYTEGLNRYKKISWRDIEAVFEGESKSYGLDVFVKKEYKGHSAWISYTLNETTEHFDYFIDDEYKPALHDQRHELKIASILNFKSVYYSMNYVFGSGLTDPFPNNDNINSQIYSRLDIAGGYKFSWKDVRFDAGLSILNLLNTQNLKYSSFVRLPSQEQNSLRIFTEAVPFTPTLFLNISF